MSEDEFTRIIHENQGLIHKVCLLYARDEDDRKDLFQDIVIQLWKSVPTFRGESKISTWMYRVALNTAVSAFRREKRRVPEIPLDEDHDQVADAREETPEDFQQLLQAIQTLQEVDRILVMLYLEGNSYDEIAAITGMSANNARVRMTRIRDRLKEKMRMHHGTGRL